MTTWQDLKASEGQAQLRRVAWKTSVHCPYTAVHMTMSIVTALNISQLSATTAIRADFIYITGPAGQSWDEAHITTD